MYYKKCDTSIIVIFLYFIIIIANFNYEYLYKLSRFAKKLSNKNALNYFEFVLFLQIKYYFY